MIVAALLSSLIGLSLGLIGGGGSILALPVLVYAAGISPSDAVGMSLVIVGGTSLVACVAWARQRQVDVAAAALFGGSGLPAAFFGARLTARVPASLLLAAFALLLVGVGLWMAFGRPPRAPRRRGWTWIAGAGLGVGFLTGFLGVGGGFLVVPALVALAGLELRRAIGTSLAVIALNSAAGWLGHLGQGAAHGRVTLILAASAILGALAGQRLAARLDASALRRVFAALVLGVGLFVGARTALSTRTAPAPPPVPLARVFGDVPWISLVPQLAPLEGVGGVRAADCGKCHPQHYAEWSRSTHAHAYTDLQFQSELGKPSSPRWLCLNCHLPVENQREAIVFALDGGALAHPVATANAGFDPAMRDEGVTCATCHVRRDAAGKSYVLGSIGGTRPPHPVRIDRAALLGRCADCHEQSYTLTPQLVCAFQTATEIQTGPTPGRSCPSCHLPEETRPLTALGTPPRLAHRHTFIGGPVPKTRALYDARFAAELVPAVDVDVDVARGGVARWEVTVRLANARAAHRVPTGDPERFLLVSAELLDAGGQVLDSRSLRIGQTWTWAPVARRVADNRLAPGETRAWLAPLAGAGAARVRVSVRHVRLTSENAAYMTRTAAQADPRFAPAIVELAREYPMATTWYQSELTLSTGERRQVSLAALIARAHDEPR